MKKNIITVTVNGNLTISGTVQEVALIIASLNGASAPVAEKPKKALRTDYTNKNVGFDNFTVNVSGKTVKFTHKDGTFLNERFVRKVLNNRVKKAEGFVNWDKESKVWVFSSAQKAKKFAEGCTTEGLDDEVNKLIQETNEKNAEKSV